MKNLTAILLSTAIFAGACGYSPNRGTTNSAETGPANNQNVSAEKTGAGAGAPEVESKSSADRAPARDDCLNIGAAGKKLDPKQTFAFDHEPFRNACFVTLYDSQTSDPPLNSEFFIYRDGKQIYKFPDQFNGVTLGCWAEGVAFQDLNEDGLTDVVIAGMCSAKSAPYSENMVYVNKGKDFATRAEANYSLEKFKKIKDITDFVKQNKAQFFR